MIIADLVVELCFEDCLATVSAYWVSECLSEAGREIVPLDPTDSVRSYGWSKTVGEKGYLR